MSTDPPEYDLSEHAVEVEGETLHGFTEGDRVRLPGDRMSEGFVVVSDVDEESRTLTFDVDFARPEKWLDMAHGTYSETFVEDENTTPDEIVDALNFTMRSLLAHNFPVTHAILHPDDYRRLSREVRIERIMELRARNGATNDWAPPGWVWEEPFRGDVLMASMNPMWMPRQVLQGLLMNPELGASPLSEIARDESLLRYSAPPLPEDDEPEPHPLLAFPE